MNLIFILVLLILFMIFIISQNNETILLINKRKIINEKYKNNLNIKINKIIQ